MSASSICFVAAGIFVLVGLGFQVSVHGKHGGANISRTERLSRGAKATCFLVGIAFGVAAVVLDFRHTPSAEDAQAPATSSGSSDQGASATTATGTSAMLEVHAPGSGVDVMPSQTGPCYFRASGRFDGVGNHYVYAEVSDIQADPTTWYVQITEASQDGFWNADVYIAASGSGGQFQVRLAEFAEQIPDGVLTKGLVASDATAYGPGAVGQPITFTANNACPVAPHND